MEKTNFDVFAGSAPILRFRLLVPEDVTDWTTTFYLKDKITDAIILSANGTFNLTDVPDAMTVGVFDIPLTKTQTLAIQPKSYNYCFWRTNPGFEDPLASGTFHLKELC
jgi:hypothetical protein